jgi:hypothetical protein
MIFAPRSCPSSPGLATTTRSGRLALLTCRSPVLISQFRFFPSASRFFPRNTDRTFWRPSTSKENLILLMCRIRSPLLLRAGSGGRRATAPQTLGGSSAHLAPLLVRHSCPCRDFREQPSATDADACFAEPAHAYAGRCRYGQGHGTRLSRDQALLLHGHHGHTRGFDHQDRLRQKIGGGILGTNSLDDLVRRALELAR